MKGSAAIFSLALVVKHHPCFVLVEAGALPLESVIRGGSGADEDGEDIDGAVEAGHDGPRYMPRQQRKHVSQVKRRFQGPNFEARHGRRYQEEQQQPRYLLRHGTIEAEQMALESQLCSSNHFLWIKNQIFSFLLLLLNIYVYFI